MEPTQIDIPATPPVEIPEGEVATTVPVIQPAPPTLLDEMAVKQPTADDLLIEMDKGSKAASVDVQNPNRMAVALEAASMGELTYQDALKQMMLTGGKSADAIRNMAAATYTKEAQEGNIYFNELAAKGMVAEAEATAQYVNNLNTAIQNISNERAIAKVNQEAALNAALANSATLENNPPDNLYKVTNDLGTLTGVEEIVSQYMQKKGLVPDKWAGWAVLGSIAGTIGLSFVAPKAGAVAGIAIGSKFAYDSFSLLPNALKNVSGIDGKGLSYAEQVQKWQGFLATLPTQEALGHITGVLKHMADNEILPGEVGKLFIAMNATRLFTSFDETKWKDGDMLPSLSLKSQEFLDRLGLGLDAATALMLVNRVFSTTKLAAATQGGSRTGAAVGGDIVNGTNKMGNTNEEQVGYALSMDLSKYLPDGVVGLPASVQKELHTNLQKTLEALETRLTVGVDKEAEALKDFLVKNSQRYDGQIVGVNLQSGEMVLQHASGAPFRNMDNAIAMAKRMEAETGLKFEVVPANEGAVSRLNMVDDDLIVGFHHSTKEFDSFKPSTKGAYGPGVYFYTNAEDAVSGALSKSKFPKYEIGADGEMEIVGYVTKPAVTYKGVIQGASRFIDATSDMSKQTEFVVRAADKLGVDTVEQLLQLPQHVLKSAGIRGIRQSVPDKRIGRTQFTVFDPADIVVANRRVYDTTDVTKYKETLITKASDAAVDVAEESNAMLAKLLKAPPPRTTKGIETPTELAERFSRGRTAEEAIAVVAKTSKDDALSMVASGLSKLSKQLGLDKVAIRLGDASSTSGYYSVANDAITIGGKVVGSERIVVHEVAHAATARVISKVMVGDYSNLTPRQVQAAKSVVNMFSDETLANKLRAATKDSAVYSSRVEHMLSDPYEFLVMGVTERGPIVDVLKNYMVEGQSALHRIAQFIADVLGINKMSAFIRMNSDFLDMVSDLSSGVRTESKFVAAMPEVMNAPLLAHGWYVRRAGNPLAHTAADIESRFGAGLDPIHRASELAVHERTFTMFSEQKDVRALTDFLKEGFKGLSRKENKRVINVLREGDELGHEFNTVELTARGLNVKEQKAYFTYRTLSNLDLDIKNTTLNENLTRRGFVQGYLRNGLITHFAPAKNVPMAEAEGRMAFNLVTNTVEKVDATKHTGMSVITTAKRVPINGQDYTLFIGNNSVMSFGRLRPQIPNKAGTFRHYYNQDFFGNVKISRMVNGEVVEDVLHLRTSNSGKDIGKWSEAMGRLLAKHKANPGSVTHADVENLVGRWEDPNEIMRSINAGEWDNYQGFGHHYDRANDSYLDTLARAQWDDDLAMSEGRGIRLKSIDADKDNILDPMQAIQAELTNVARHRNIDAWRDKWVETWWNSFSHLLPESVLKNGRSPLSIMSDPTLQLSTYTRSDSAGKFAESQRNYIMQQLGVKTLDESLLENALRRVTDGWSSESKVFGLPVGEKLITAGHALRNADPLQFIRSFNFFTMLSAFNPAQLMVQAAGAVTALAISPIHGLKAAYTAPLLRVALASDNPAVWHKLATVETWAKLGLSSRQEFVDVVAAIKKVGLIDGIVGTSMHSAEAGRFNMLTGFVSKMGEKSAFFFNRGEEFSRLTSFDVARREFMAAHPGVAWNSDDALKTIVARADDFTQNMTRSNMAFYQRGALSIPAQFLQYNIKLAANLTGAVHAWGKGAVTGTTPLYRGFTMKEALSIMAGHTVMYGLAGNGLMMFADEIVGGYEKLVGREVTDDEKLAFSQGTIAALINEVSQATTGEDTKLAIGSRLGVFEYYDKLARTAMKGDAEFWSVVLGPSYGSASRLGAMKALVEPFVRKDLSTDAFAEAFSVVGKETFSGWRSASKAYYAKLHDGAVPDKSGTPMVTVTKGEIIAQYIGIGSSVEQDWWRMQLSYSDRKKAVKEFAQSFMEVEKTRLEVLKNEGENSQRYKALTDYMTSLHSSLPAGEREMFFKEITKPVGAAATAPFIDRFQKQRADILWGNWTMKDVLNTRTGKLTEHKPLENNDGN